jgi:hypothetical protein
LREEEIPHSTNGHSEKRQLTNSSGRSLDDDKLASKRHDGKWAPTNGISFDGRELGRWYDFCCWQIAAPDVCDGTSAVGESRHPIRWSEPCLEPHNLTTADVYFGRAETILAERQRIKRATKPPLAAPIARRLVAVWTKPTSMLR